MSRLANLKLAQLRPLLTLIGSRTSGTKSALISLLEKDVGVPQLVFKNQKTRLLSVDMGIKNLAFCVCDVKRDGMEVIDWKKIAVTDGEMGNEDPFTPPELSKTAFTLVKDVLLPYGPDTVLIERQRFRSGGGSAVQEWTLRVNMLESMIWAILTALGGSHGKPDLWAVSPKQVAAFWVGDVAADAKLGRSKIEKKQKIDLVTKWLNAGTREEGFLLDFTGEAVRTKTAYVEAASKKSAVKVPMLDTDGKPQKAAERISKLDDLADCLLQAAAWWKWEANKRALAPLIKEGNEEKLIKWLEGKI